MANVMHDEEAVQMMRRCVEEILSLRSEVATLKPKADAYDSIVTILGLLPRASQAFGENIVWVLEKRIREIEQAVKTEPAE